MRLAIVHHLSRRWRDSQSHVILEVPYAKVLAALVAAYALSPIDPIPDFIPVLGYLDELINSSQ